MSPRCALKTILFISIAGMLFSGFLSYQELFGSGCQSGCSTATSHLLGLPVCVYGLVMYTAVFLSASLGLKGNKSNIKE